MLKGQLELSEIVGDESHAAGLLQLVKKLLLFVAKGVEACFHFDAYEYAVSEAEADDVEHAVAALGIFAPAAGLRVVDAAGVLTPHFEAVVGEAGNDGSGYLASFEGAQVEG